MPAAQGFVQLNFQVPQATYDKLVAECDTLKLKKGEFLSRMVVLYFLSKELGYGSTMIGFMTTGVFDSR